MRMIGKQTARAKTTTDPPHARGKRNPVPCHFYLQVIHCQCINSYTGVTELYDVKMYGCRRGTYAQSVFVKALCKLGRIILEDIYHVNVKILSINWDIQISC